LGSCGDANMFSVCAKYVSIGEVLMFLVGEVVVVPVFLVCKEEKGKINIIFQFFFVRLLFENKKQYT
jgi:hypothetical protein